MAARAARNAIAIADRRGEVISAFPLDSPEKKTLLFWTVFGPEPATLVFLAGELPGFGPRNNLKPTPVPARDASHEVARP